MGSAALCVGIIHNRKIAAKLNWPQNPENGLSCAAFGMEALHPVMLFLIGGGRSSSVSLRILASALEAHERVHVVVHELDLRPSAESVPRQLDRTVGRIDEGDAQHVGVHCSLWNAGVAAELCQRLRCLWPDLPLSLFGPGAPHVARQLADPAVRLDELVPRVTARTKRTLPFCHARLGEIVRAAARLGGPVHVEPLEGASLPAHHARLNPGCNSVGISVPQTLAWANPLLGAGLTVRLDAPIGAGTEALNDLVAGLSPGRLLLEAPAELIHPEVVEQLARIGAARVDLDVSRLGVGDLDSDTLSRAMERLQDHEIPARGILVYGRPGLDADGEAEAVDAALSAGVENLTLRRLLVPPASRLREIEALAAAPAPPYTVLRHPECSPTDLLRLDRLASTISALGEALEGTGVLRALSRALGSAVEPLEGFGELLAAGRMRPTPERTAEMLFADYLRDHHGVDLNPSGDGLELMRSPGIALRWPGDGCRLVTDESTGRVAHLGRGAVNLLDLCDGARTIRDLCAQLAAEAPPDRRDGLQRELRVTVEKLATMGFLVPAAGQDNDSSEPPFWNLDEFEYHCRLLADRQRVDAYARAICAAVRPGQHVLEIGTGTGILAVLAARAGARVTAVERYAVIQVARRMADRCGVADRIRFIRGRSDLVQTEPADLLVCELVGNRVLNEGILEVMLDARKRLLRPDARLIPCRLTLLARLGRSDRFRTLRRELHEAGGRHGLDLSAVGAWLEDKIAAGALVWEEEDDGEDFSPLSDDTVVTDLDLAGLEHAEIDHPFTVTATRADMANAVALSFRLELQPGIELSTCGRPHGLHWNRPVLMLASPAAVEPGTPLRFRLCSRRGGELRLLPESQTAR